MSKLLVSRRSWCSSAVLGQCARPAKPVRAAGEEKSGKNSPQDGIRFRFDESLSSLGTLPAKLPAEPTLFQALTQGDDTSSSKEFPRLSVTRLLSRQWCQLQYVYQIYSGKRFRPTFRMKRGTKSHYKLEKHTHPEVQYDKIVFPGFHMSRADTEAEIIAERISKLIDLLYKCHAREVYIHGFLGLDGQPVLDGFGDNQHVLVTGVVDHIEISRAVLLPEDGHQAGLSELIAAARSRIRASSSSLAMVISDVKTRGASTLPSLGNTIEYSKIQVLTYKDLVRTITSSPSVCARSHYEYFRRKRVDLDGVVSPEFAVNLLRKFPYYTKEFERLCTGGGSGGVSSYSWGGIAAQSEFDQLNRPWASPLTVRYFLDRYIELLTSLASLVPSCSTNIKYYHRGENFATVEFEDDQAAVHSNYAHNMRLWNNQLRPDESLQHSTDAQICTGCAYVCQCPKAVVPGQP